MQNKVCRPVNTEALLGLDSDSLESPLQRYRISFDGRDLFESLSERGSGEVLLADEYIFKQTSRILK